MPDITAVATILSGVKTAADIAKVIKDSGTSLEQAETKLKLADLITTLADVKMEMAGIQELILEKDQKISELQESLALKGSVIYEQPYYWLTAPGEKDGPFCQQCYDSKDKLIRLQSAKGISGLWSCKACNSKFQDDSYSPPSSSRKSSSRRLIRG